MKNVFKNHGFGDRLHLLREKANLSQSELAKQLGYKRSSSISNMETGKTPPDIVILIKLAQVFNTNLHWLIIGEPSPDGERWRESYIEVARITGTYIAWDNTRLGEERQTFVRELADLREKQSRGEGVSPERVSYFEEKIAKIEKKVSENNQTQHRILERIYGKKL